MCVFFKHARSRQQCAYKRRAWNLINFDHDDLQFVKWWLCRHQEHVTRKPSKNKQFEFDIVYDVRSNDSWLLKHPVIPTRSKYLQNAKSSSNKPASKWHPVCNSLSSQRQNIPFRFAACKTWLSVCKRYHEKTANSESTELKWRLKFTCSFYLRATQPRCSSCLVATPRRTCAESHFFCVMQSSACIMGGVTHPSVMWSDVSILLLMWIYRMNGAIITEQTNDVEYFCYFVANQNLTKFLFVWHLNAKGLEIILYPVFACHVVTDDSKPRSTWLSCLYGSSRGFLCGEKELVSFLEGKSTPWGKIFIISLNRMSCVWTWFAFEVRSHIRM